MFNNISAKMRGGLVWAVVHIKKKYFDDIINILENVNTTRSSDIVEENKHLFLGKYEAYTKTFIIYFKQI